MDKDQILAALPALNHTDLQAVAAVTGKLLADTADGVAGDPAKWLYEALAGMLGLPFSYDYMQRQHSAKQFNANAPVFLAFMTANLGERVFHKKVVCIAVMNTLLQLICDDLKAKRVPVTLGTVSMNLPRIATVFEQAFPGYIESNLASMAVKVLHR